MEQTNTSRIWNFIGLGLVAIFFLVAAVPMVWKSFTQSIPTESKEITIRFAHWQLEGGVRRAFDLAAADYTKLHPNIRVEQLAIPDKIYVNWLITQLIGGTAPDIVQMGKGMSDERTTRYFLPTSALATKPNPYNKGTILENTPLRETFIDDMESVFSTTLLDHYGVPLSAFTLRMYYNLNLLQEITGNQDLPVTYGQFANILKQTTEFSQKTKKRLYHIAASGDNAPSLIDKVFRSQTGKLGDRLAYDFLPSTRPPAAHLGIAFANGEWDFNEPSMRAAVTLLRHLGSHLQPGFMQVSRDDAMFNFIQGNALMMPGGSWDYSSISAQADFPVGVGMIPTPLPDEDSRWPFSDGIISDESTNASVVMAVTKESQNPEIAQDFLLFLCSLTTNEMWAQESGWLPAVNGAKIGTTSQSFMPNLEGFTGGFSPGFSGADTKRVIQTSIGLAVNPSGSVDKFTNHLNAEFRNALASDLERNAIAAKINSQRADTVSLALYILSQNGDASAADKLAIQLEGMSATDRGYQLGLKAIKLLK